MSHMAVFRAALDVLRGPTPDEIAKAKLAEQELRLLRATLDNPVTHGGFSTDVVSLHLTKKQIAMLAALVERALN